MNKHLRRFIIRNCNKFWKDELILVKRYNWQFIGREDALFSNCYPSTVKLICVLLYFMEKPRVPQLEETPEMPPSSRGEGLLFLPGLESNHESSLISEEEAGLPWGHSGGTKISASRLGRRADPLLPLEARPDSPGEHGMQPRDPCLPLERNIRSWTQA